MNPHHAASDGRIRCIFRHLMCILINQCRHHHHLDVLPPIISPQPGFLYKRTANFDCDASTLLHLELISKPQHIASTAFRQCLLSHPHQLCQSENGEDRHLICSSQGTLSIFRQLLTLLLLLNVIMVIVMNTIALPSQVQHNCVPIHSASPRIITVIPYLQASILLMKKMLLFPFDSPYRQCLYVATHFDFDQHSQG